MSQVVLHAIADNTIIEDPEGKLSNGKGAFILVGRTNQAENSIRRGLLKFDVISDLPEGAQVSSVTLTLNLFKVPPPGGTVDISLHRVLSDWGEGESNAQGGGMGNLAQPEDATWLYGKYDTECWQSVGGDFTSDASATSMVGSDPFAFSWSSSGMVDDVKAWRQNPDSNYGWLLLGSETSPQTVRGFASNDYPATAPLPKLTIEFTL